MIISIVGGGATGITILRHLAELAASGRDNGAISGIQLFDKSGFDGGVAYRTQSDRHLLNMKASTMSIRPGDADEFLRWLRARGLSCHGNRHLPRMVYRDYLDAVRLAAIAQCRSAGVPVHVEHAEIVRMRFSPDRDVLLTTDLNITHISSVLILCTGHNAPDDHYGLAANPNYIRDPYAQFAFADRDGVEVGILGSGLSAVDTAAALAKTHQSVRMTCFSRSGLFPTVQPVTSPAIANGFRDALHRYVASRERIEADAFAARLSELLLETTGIRCDLSCRNVGGDALADLERNIGRAESGEPSVHSYLVSVIDVMCDAWSRMRDVEKMRFMDVYNSGWLRNRSAMPLENAIRIRPDALGQALGPRPAAQRDRHRRPISRDPRRRRSSRRRLRHRRDRTVLPAGHQPALSGHAAAGAHRVRRLGGIRCGYDDSRVHDRHGTAHPNVYAVGGPTKGTHFYAAAVDINLRRAQEHHYL
ncbi:cation diffusion facilitator CzcD-associated flavoprotein CzcO [Bradyrhizobium sp. USDA 3311]